MKVAALFVRTNGHYYGLDYVEPWDINRDARKYDGPYPVVAHPPCARWSILAASVYARMPIEEKKPGNDGGCFESALSSVRKYCGVLEHPAKSAAFKHHGIKPPETKGWQQDIDGSWICEVHQSAYGHKAEKNTWLYYVGHNPPCPVSIYEPDCDYVVATTKADSNSKLLTKNERLDTPIKFRNYLIKLARNSVKT